MKKKVFNATLLSGVGSMLLAMLLVTFAMYYQNTQVMMEGMRAQAVLATQGVTEQGKSFLTGLKLGQYRLTWISSDGSVLYDSAVDSNSMENHADREEIQNALVYGYGEGERMSDTLLVKQIYVAQKLPDRSVLRISTTQDTWVGFVGSILTPLVAVVGFTFLLGLYLSRRVTAKIIAPINTLDLEHPLRNDNAYEELSPLLSRLEIQRNKIKRQMEQLGEQRNQFEHITEQMEEGLILLGDKGHILSINQTGLRLFDTEQSACTGQHYLTLIRTISVQKRVQDGLAGVRGAETLTLEGREYQLNVTPILHEETVDGVVLLLVDMTERVRNEQLRREFTANVSHELKTPIHSISGCAELLCNGLVAEGDIAQFSKQIYNESQRLIRLVEEIIGLARLDEGAQEVSRTAVELKEIAAEALSGLEELARENQVTLTLTGETSQIEGNRTLLISMMKNLCENAVRYNKVGGTVAVEVRATTPQITIKDNGIGIASEDQTHIFERFYRVDKSRSKENGGTGLGLSIVKHAAVVHSAEIILESELGTGTTVKINFQ